MQCPRCHAENRDGLRFCEDYGGRLTLACSQCGGELAPGKRSVVRASRRRRSVRRAHAQP
jgi:hypothetical protein